jgi:ribosomal protein L37AE/L43A
MHTLSTRNPICTECGINKLQHARAALGYTVCLSCGEQIAQQRKHITAPINKSSYMLITDLTLLKQLNPKRA